MKHTNENLSKLSDQDINELVFLAMGFEVSCGDVEIPDFCNKPEAIMPIVILNGINHAEQIWLNTWKAYKPVKNGRWSWYQIESTNKNLLRSYCECYILCKQGDV